MSLKAPNFGRLDNSEKVVSHVQEAEQPMVFSPNDHFANRFFGTWSKVLTATTMLDHETQEKYLGEFTARYKARVELGAVPKCFDKCIGDIDAPVLSADEKNCVRECYFKRVTSRDDVAQMMLQRLAIDNARDMRDELV